MVRILSRLVITAGLLALATPAFAQNTTALTVNASVQKSCVTVTKTQTVAVPAWDPIAGAPSPGTANIDVKCTKGTTVQVSASMGTNASAGVRYVASASASDKIGYKIFANSVELTDATVFSSAVAGNGKSTNSTIPIDVALDANADPKAATDYTDSLTLTFTAN